MAPKRRRTDNEPHVRLTRWLRAQTACVEGLEIRSSPGGLGLFATRDFVPGDIIGGLPEQAILDPEAVLATDPVAIRALKLGATEPFAFWLALAGMAQDEDCHFYAYLAACPREAPDPCAWSAAQRKLLAGTPVAAQVRIQKCLP